MLNKFLSIANEMGYVNAFLYSFNQLLTKLNMPECVFHYILFAQPVKNTALLPERRGKSIAVRQLNQGDRILRQLPPPESALAVRFAQNATCLAAFKNGELIGCMWLCLSQYMEDEVRCLFLLNPVNNAAWDFDIYIKPQHRTGLAFAKLWDEANQYLRNRNVDWTFSRISAFNVPSLASHQRLGAVKIGQAYFLKIFTWQVMLSNISPYINISFRSAPNLRLYAPTSEK